MQSEIGTIISRQLHPGLTLNQKIFVSIRPERVKILQDSSTAMENTFEGKILKKAFLGEKNERFLQIQGTDKEIDVSTDPGFDFDLGGQIHFHVLPANCSLVPP